MSTPFTPSLFKCTGSSVSTIYCLGAKLSVSVEISVSRPFPELLTSDSSA